jgi:hypothetical protein
MPIYANATVVLVVGVEMGQVKPQRLASWPAS